MRLRLYCESIRYLLKRIHHIKLLFFYRNCKLKAILIFFVPTFFWRKFSTEKVSALSTEPPILALSSRWISSYWWLINPIVSNKAVFYDHNNNIFQTELNNFIALILTELFAESFYLIRQQRGIFPKHRCITTTKLQYSSNWSPYKVKWMDDFLNFPYCISPIN